MRKIVPVPSLELARKASRQDSSSCCGRGLSCGEGRAHPRVEAVAPRERDDAGLSCYANDVVWAADGACMDRCLRDGRLSRPCRKDSFGDRTRSSRGNGREEPKLWGSHRGHGRYPEGAFRHRWAGKERGVRVVYYFQSERMPVYLLTVFAKNEKSNLTKAERNALARLVVELKRAQRR